MCGSQQTPGDHTGPVVGHHLLVPPHLAAAYGYMSYTRCSLYVLLWHGAPAVLIGVRSLLSVKVVDVAPGLG